MLVAALMHSTGVKSSVFAVSPRASSRPGELSGHPTRRVRAARTVRIGSVGQSVEAKHNRIAKKGHGRQLVGRQHEATEAVDGGMQDAEGAPL